MNHTCAICEEKFSLWMLYSLHKEMFHTQTPIALPGVKHPLTRAAKALLVARGEARLGNQHFIGGTI